MVITRSFLYHMSSPKKKILLPYSTHFKASVEDGKGKVITGGIEKFCFDLEQNIDEIIPVEITQEDKEGRNTKKRIEEAIIKHEPDAIMFNNPWWAKMMLSFNVRLICIMHEPLVRDIRMIELGNLLKSLQDKGCHLYFVSPVQLKYHRAMAKRLQGVELKDPHGFIRPSFLSETNVVSEDFEYDCATIGRNDTEKAPFLLHEKLKGSDLISLVMTNDGEYKSESLNAYVEKNKKWKYPRETIRGLPHNEVMSNLCKAKVFVSTWPKESWGITAMEALGKGIPTILFTDDTGTHASEIVAASDQHITKIRRTCSPEEFQTTVQTLIQSTDNEKRKEISRMTKDKHSIDSWKSHIQDIIEKRMADDTGRNSLEHLFS